MALRSEAALIKAEYETSLIQELLKLGAFIHSGKKELNNTHSERGKNGAHVLFFIILFTNYFAYAPHKYQ